MKRLLSGDRLLFLFYFTGCFLFFELNYRYWYRFMEQYNLFLFREDFFTELLKQPGGVNEYITAFVTQFFILPFFASGSLAVLSGIIILFFHLFLRRCGVNAPVIVAIAPAFLFWIYPVESISSVTAVLLGIGFALGYSSVKKPVRYVLGFVLLWPIYALAAPAHLLAVALMAVYEVSGKEGKSRFMVAAGLVLWAFAIPLLAMRTVYILPVREAFLSKHLYHPEYPIPASFGYIWCSFPLIALLAYTFRKKKTVLKKEWMNIAVQALILTLITGGFILYKQHPLEQVYRYDWYARQQQWEKIAAHAEKHPVKDKDALVYINLAYAYMDRFNEALMRFPQIGEEGFIPYDPKTRLGLIEASEVAWLVNQTNAAQRFAFVGVLSAERCVQPRLMKRLVETYLVNKEYQAAGKYIRILEGTLFYSRWAKEQRLLLNPGKAGLADWIVQRRKLNPITDNTHDPTKTLSDALAYLISDHPENKKALEYGMGCLLIYKDLGTFMHYMNLLKEKEEPIPSFYQEAICIYYSAVENNPEAFRSYAIDPKVYERFQSYLSQVQRLSPALLSRQFGDTYYYYAQFVQPPKRPNR
jgi:tetratricopeptide (TPR) repeat protein